MKHYFAKYVCFFLILTLSLIKVEAQGQANNWYFGSGAGLSFNSSPPQALNDGKLETLEGCATISDDTGSLLFYTDGNIIYNRTGDIMTNGTGLLGDTSSTQSAIIIPKPQSTTIFYVFTVDIIRPTDSGSIVSTGVNYSIVDFTNNPNGEVTLKNKNLLGFSAEKLSAVIKDCDSDSVWMVTLSTSNGNIPSSGTRTINFNTFYAYSITASGLDLNPVKSPLPVQIGDQRGVLKFAPNGKQLAAACAQSGLYLMDFDSQSGRVSNPQLLEMSGIYYAPYGVEFSPNSKLLYVDAYDDLPVEESTNSFSGLLQYDLFAADIKASEVVLDQQNIYRSSLQLAPDGKIYRSMSASYFIGLPFLSVIESPNVKGLGANYNDRAINLGKGISNQGLPPFNQSLFNDLDIIQNDEGTKELALCDGDSYTLKYEEVLGATYEWFHNEKIIPGETTYELSIKQPAGLKLPYSESYKFKVTPNDGSCEKVGVAEVTYYAYPTPLSGVELVQCEDSATADGLSIFNLTEANAELTNNDPTLGVSYHYSLNDAKLNLNPIDPIGYENSSLFEILYARVFNDAGCAAFTSLNIAVSSTAATTGLLEECDLNDTGFVTFNLGDANAQVLGTATGNPDIRYYLTERGALLEEESLELPVNYMNTTPYNQLIFARVENKNDCFAISEVELRINPRPDFTLPAEAFYCASNFPNLQIFSPDYSNLDMSETYTYQWFPDGQITPDLETNLTGVHTLRVTNVFTNCFREATFTIIEKEVAIIQNIEVTDASENNTALINVTGNGDYEFTLDDPIGPYQDSNLFTGLLPGFHKVYVRSKEGCGTVEQEFSIIGFSKYFTPNGDGYHDTWQVQGISELVQPGTVIRVFDRYGKLLKEINPLSYGWDGTFRGTNLPSDDYWFDVQLEDGRIFKSHFTLKR